MANKSFVTQYIIKARNQFSTAADASSKSSKEMRASINRTQKEVAAAAQKMKASSGVMGKSIRQAQRTTALATVKMSSSAALIGTSIQKAQHITATETRKMRRSFNLTKISLRDFDVSFEKTANKMRTRGIVMTAAITVPLAFAALSLKNAARDAIETRAKFATVFKDMSSQAKAAADGLATGFGLSGSKARELLGDTGDLLTGFGFTQEGALSLATQVNELAVDLASFTNFSGGAEGASAALNRALLGERESLKTLGIAILEKDVLAKVSLMLAEGQTFASLRQAKAEATLALAIGQSKNAIGDFARTQEELANQERITSSRLQDLKEAFGTLLLPVALKVTKAMRAMFVALTDLSPGAKKALLGVGVLLAVLGPLLLMVGALALAIPALSTGFIALGVFASGTLLPLLPLIASFALLAAVIVANWDKVSAFFKGFGASLQSSLGPTLSGLVDKFTEAAGVIAKLFGKDSDAAQSLMELTNIGELIGEVVGGSLALIIRGISGMGEILGQLIASTVSLDFSQFDIGAIKAQFLGTAAQPAQAESRVDVGLTVGLDKGLTQTDAATFSGIGPRRLDVGAT